MGIFSGIVQEGENEREKEKNGWVALIFFFLECITFLSLFVQELSNENLFSIEQSYLYIFPEYSAQHHLSRVADKLPLIKRRKGERGKRKFLKRGGSVLSSELLLLFLLLCVDRSAKGRYYVQFCQGLHT